MKGKVQGEFTDPVLFVKSVFVIHCEERKFPAKSRNFSPRAKNSTPEQKLQSNSTQKLQHLTVKISNNGKY